MTSLGNLFAFSIQASGQIRIPKAALPGLDNPAQITANQFFAAIILRGMNFYKPQAWGVGDRRIAIDSTNTHYMDLSLGKIINVVRTQVKIEAPSSTPKLEDLE